MKSPKDMKRQIGLLVTDEELQSLDWLAKETKRTRSGVIKWATDKAAKELGYVPKKSGK